MQAAVLYLLPFSSYNALLTCKTQQDFVFFCCLVVCLFLCLEHLWFTICFAWANLSASWALCSPSQANDKGAAPALSHEQLSVCLCVGGTGRFPFSFRPCHLYSSRRMSKSSRTFRLHFLPIKNFSLFFPLINDITLEYPFPLRPASQPLRFIWQRSDNHGKHLLIPPFIHSFRSRFLDVIPCFKTLQNDQGEMTALFEISWKSSKIRSDSPIVACTSISCFMFPSWNNNCIRGEHAWCTVNATMLLSFWWQGKIFECKCLNWRQIRAI